MHHPTTSSTGTTRLRGGPAPDPTPVRRTIVEFPTRTLVRVVVALIIFGLAVNLLATLRDVVVWTATALFLAIALDPAVSRLELRMARPAAVLIVFGLFALGLLVVIGALMMPLITQLDEISKHGPGDLERLPRTGPLVEHRPVLSRAPLPSRPAGRARPPLRHRRPGQVARRGGPRARLRHGRRRPE